MHRKRRLSIQDFNPHLICVLCGGYFIDATTIIECLHSFCRACIVRHLEGSKYCPICDVQVHKTKPLQNIRQDPALQDIVYKLVPGLFQNEMRCRREFRSRHPDSALPNISITDPSSIYTPDETFSLSLEYWRHSDDPHVNKDEINPEGGHQARRYLRCPGAVTVAHLHKLIRGKFDLNSSHTIEFFYKDELLQDYLTLMDVAYIYKWRRKGPLHLSYRIGESCHKRMKLNLSNAYTEHSREMSCTDSSLSDNTKCDKIQTSDWKEVQIQISETGVMSVTGITLEDSNIDINGGNTVEIETESSSCEKSEALTPVLNQSNLLKLKLDHDKFFDQSTCRDVEVRETDQSQHAQLDIETKPTDTRKQIIPQVDPLDINVCQSETLECNNNSKEHSVYPDPVPTDTSKPHTLSQESISSIAETVKDTTSMSSQRQSKSLDVHVKCETLLLSEKSSCNTNNEALNVGTKFDSGNHHSGNAPKEHSREHFLVAKNHKPQTVKSSPVMVVAPTQNVKKTNSGSMGYKTLKVPPKTWNPSITRSSYLNSKNHNTNLEPNINVSTVNPLKSSEKAPRFFKMRNMPRYLGNPASGVKPMYQVAGNSKVSSPGPPTKSKPVVMKIDPKTLSPIVAVVTSSNVLPGPQNKTFYTAPQPPRVRGAVDSTVPGLNFTQSKLNVLGSRDKVPHTKNVFTSHDGLTRVIPTTGSPTLPPNTDIGANARPVSPSNKLGKTISNHYNSQTFPTSTSSTTGTSSSMISSPNVSHPPNFALNPATLNMLASSPSFLPNATNFLYGNFTNFAPPLLSAGLHLNSNMGLGPGSGVGSGSNIMPGLGAYHSMPPSINMLFPHHRSTDRSSGFPTHPPAVQRIPPSKNNSSSNIGHKLHHNNNNNYNNNYNSSVAISSSMKKNPLQSNAKNNDSECYLTAKNNVCNPKNGIDNDSAQLPKSTGATGSKQKNSHNDEVCSPDQQTLNLELNLNISNTTSQKALENSESFNKTKVEAINISNKSKEDTKRTRVKVEITGADTQDSRSEVDGHHLGAGSEIQEADVGVEHARDKSEKSLQMLTIHTPFKSSSFAGSVKSGQCDLVEVEKSSLALSNLAKLTPAESKSKVEEQPLKQ